MTAARKQRPSQNAGIWDEAEQALHYANHSTRGDCLVQLFRTKHPRRVELLGENWSDVDAYGPELRGIVQRLARPALKAMTEDECNALAALPDEVVIWRGCYGVSWTLDEAIARRFPYLLRYRMDGQPLLLEGRVQRRDINFLKHGRGESEVVAYPSRIRLLQTTKLADPPWHDTYFDERGNKVPGPDKSKQKETGDEPWALA
jgi:hypothetical protein